MQCTNVPAGTALFTKIKPVSVTKGIGVEDHDDEGRCITAEFDNFYLVNTYIPNAGLKLKEYGDYLIDHSRLTRLLALPIVRSGTKRF